MSLVATIAALTVPELIGIGVAVGATEGLISSAVKGEDVGKGMLIGAGTGLVTAGVGAGVGGLAGSALTGAVGNIGAGAVVGGVAGAAGGAAGSAMKGEDIGKGAMLGGAGGAVTGAAAGALGGAANGGGAETAAGPGAVPTGVAPTPPPVGPGAAPIGGTAPVAGATPGAAPIGGTAPVAGATPGAGTAPLTKIAPEPPNALVAGINKTLGTDSTGKEMLGGLGVIGTGAGSEYTIQGVKAQDAINATASEEDKARGLDFASQGSSGLAGVRAAGLPDGSGPLGGLGSIGRATGGITALAHGGQVPLGDGAYIIPADVVSALGNGSSKAGADYLRRLMIEVRKEAVGRQGMGAAKKHVS